MIFQKQTCGCPQDFLWASCFIEVFDYERVGGSVAHASLDLAINWDAILLYIGTGRAFSKGGEQYLVMLIWLSEEGLQERESLW